MRRRQPARPGRSGSASPALIEGKVTVTDGTDSVSFGPGDLVVFPEELECTWNVHEAVAKHYNFG
ncbi:MAG: cupin domain-containing protein [Planctomycetota bacterium]|jgi:uncharacterized cupin superfamily protein